MSNYVERTQNEVIAPVEVTFTKFPDVARLTRMGQALALAEFAMATEDLLRQQGFLTLDQIKQFGVHLSTRSTQFAVSAFVAPEQLERLYLDYKDTIHEVMPKLDLEYVEDTAYPSKRRPPMRGE